MGRYTPNEDGPLTPGEKCTVYTAAGSGFGWAKHEARWCGLDRRPADAGWMPGAICCVYITPKRARKLRCLMTYYCPTILVARGWGLPDLRPNFVPEPSSTPGVHVKKGRHTFGDPAWDRELAEDTADVTFELEVHPHWREAV